VSKTSAAILGAMLAAGLAVAGWFVYNGIVAVKALERVVTVKGLSEREVPADIAIWPIAFRVASNELDDLTAVLRRNNGAVVAFLQGNGFEDDEISVAIPTIQDLKAQGYADPNVAFRYTASSTVTLYTRKVDAARAAMARLLELGAQGIAVTGGDYNSRTEFIFTGLNDLKPAMIEEATRNAREVAEKFAHDSASRLGKIRAASQGQFSISDRDSTTPHIKKVRVVATVEYYLSD
jgi:hypothetical protein